MKSGIQLIADERQHQIDKYGFTGEHHRSHPEWYDKGQLLQAASLLCLNDWGCNDEEEIAEWYCPINWDKKWWRKLVFKPHEERKIIAAAMIAADIDMMLSTTPAEVSAPEPGKDKPFIAANVRDIIDGIDNEHSFSKAVELLNEVAENYYRPVSAQEVEGKLFTYDDMMDIAGFMAAADCNRPIHELKEEAEHYIATRKNIVPSPSPAGVTAEDAKQLEQLKLTEKNAVIEYLNEISIKQKEKIGEAKDLAQRVKEDNRLRYINIVIKIIGRYY